MRAVIAVHLGSAFVSGSAEVADWKLAEVIDGVRQDIYEADGLVIIDGMFSQNIPSDLQREIAEALDNSARNREVSARVWGCDSGEGAYPDWQGRDGGFGLYHLDQEVAALAAADFLLSADEIVVTGAWATRDGKSGCVCDVADALRTALPEKCNVRVSPNSLYEEYRDEFSPFDDEHEEEVSP
ncbi:hypothetical protein KUV57_12495 [Epibacterium sp. DP7N7-1]|nr:hypothetical protein [Epibacterium sp. DP7N7-1]